MENNILDKALTVLSVEKTLLDISKPTYDKVVAMLNKEYHCGFTDCYEHPEYLSATLKKLYGNAYNLIVEKIREQLEEFSYHKPISTFLEIINK